MLKLPADCAPGLYNVWVSNRYGWSRGFTMNAARPLFLSQEASYAGLEIEVVGRNYFVDEFGMAEAGRSNIKIKLVRTGDETGAADGKTEEILLSPKTGIRYTAAESVTGKAVDESNPYRLTFETPAVKEYGTYAVYVANDGVHFRTLDNGQKLVLKAKKQGDANASLFGESSGYDPLGLGVYWAQDLHYDNVERMKAAEGRDDKDDTLSIQSKIDALSGAGGGIVFFPNGTYIVERLEMASNVILLGQSNGADGVRGQSEGFHRGIFYPQFGQQQRHCAAHDPFASRLLRPRHVSQFRGQSRLLFRRRSAGTLQRIY